MEIQITDFDETQVAVLEHRGAPELLNNSINMFIEWRKQSRLSPIATSQTYGIGYNDPTTTEPEKFRFDICASVETQVPPNPQGVINKIIPGGRCALIRYVRSHEEMGEKVRYLYEVWLPDSGEELSDFPCFFHYLNLSSEVQEHDFITDIYLPLKNGFNAERQS